MKTKPHSFATLAAALVVGLASTTASAQDKPAAPDADKPAASQAQTPPPPPAADRPRGEPGRERDGYRDDMRPPGPAMKPTSYIGVLTRPPSPDVRAQVGLADGFGLLVEEVMDGSPAKSAGVQQYDVISLFNDQRLANMDQLSALIRSMPKDSEVTLTLIRASKEIKVPVKIGETLMASSSPGNSKPWGEQIERIGQQAREKAEHMRERAEDIARDLRNKMQQLGRGMEPNNRRDNPERDFKPEDRRNDDQPRGQQPPQNERRGPPNPEPFRKPNTVQQSSSSTSVSVASATGPDGVISSSTRNLIRRDDSGEYSLSEVDGKKTFAVKPTQGETRSFEVSTEAQVNALPEALREKFRELDRVSRGEPSALGAK